jgi:hypothetical protein
MDGINIFLVVMACSGDALTCNDLSRLAPYPDMNQCQTERSEILASNLGWPGSDGLIFAQCQYVPAGVNRATQRRSDDCCVANLPGW